MATIIKTQFMRKSLLSIVIIAGSLGLSPFANAQSVYVDVATERGLMSKNVSAKVDAVGSPYIEEEYQPIRIKGYDNQIYSGRYNGYNGEMEVNLGGNQIIALDTSGDVEVVFTKDNKIYRTYTYETESGIRKKGFLAVVSENEKYTLLKEETVKYYDGEKATSSYERDKPAKFRRESDVYYIFLDGTVSFLPQKENDLLKQFPKDSKAIKDFIKSKKLKIKREEDLIELSQFISTL